MTEEFLLIGFDEVVISIPHYKIRNHYPTRPPLVWACYKTPPLMKQQLKFPFYPAMQMLRSVLKINRLQLRSSSFQVVSLVVGLWSRSLASPKSCRSEKMYDSIYAKEITAFTLEFLLWQTFREIKFEMKCYLY